MSGLEIDVGGVIEHRVSNSGKITLGSPTRGGEIYFTFDPGEYESQMVRAENAIRLLEYAKRLYSDPENLLPKREVKTSSGGATATVNH